MGNNNGRFSDGFLMGAIIGGAAVFLLGTEKGNKVLKLMLEEGRAGFSELMDEIDEYKGKAQDIMELVEDEEVDDIDEAIEGEGSTEQTSEAPKKADSSHESKNGSSSKRFFKKGK